MTTEYVSPFVADPLPFARLLGLELVTVTPDRVEAILQVREELCTHPAVRHGGAVEIAFAVAEDASAALVARLNEAGQGHLQWTR